MTATAFPEIAFPREDEGAEAPSMEILVRRQLELLGEDPDRDGLVRTPERVARSLTWLTRGYGRT